MFIDMNNFTQREERGTFPYPMESLSSTYEKRNQ